MQVQHSPPTATKQRWQPASQVVQVKDLPAVEERVQQSHNSHIRFAPEQPEPTRMRNMDKKIDMSQEPDPDWFQWWIDPAINGKPEPDPEDLQSVQRYIKSNYTPETQEKITIHVRDKKFDDS